MKPAGDSRGKGKVAAVTGATGFVGGKLAGRLAGEGFSLRCLVREKSDTALLRSLGAELVRGDLEDEASLRSLPSGCDCVFHVAAKVSDWGRREDFFRQNVEATRTLLDASVASGVRRFVHMSSSTVTWNSSFFAPSDLADIDETHPYPQSYDDSYNETKALSEKLVMEYNGKGGLETVAVRPSQVWGAGDAVILPRLVEASLKGVLVNMGFNEKMMSPCHVLNLAHATLLCASVPRAAGNVYFVNDGESMDKNRFVADQLAAAGIEWKPRITVPYALGYLVAFVLEKIYAMKRSETPPVLTRFAVSALSKSRTYSAEKARRELGYEPVCGYEKGLGELSRWVSGMGGYEKLVAGAK